MVNLEFWIIAKEWLALFKKRLMLFTMLFAIPISLSFLFGYSMEAKQIKNIPTVIIDRDNSAISRSITEEIRSNEIFNIVSFSDKDSDIKDFIEQGNAMVGVVIPASFSKDLVDGKGPNVLVFYDGSQMSIASAAKSRMTEILLTIKTGYLKNVMEGKLNVLPSESIKAAQPMYFTYRLLNNPTRNYVNFLLPGMLIAVIQVGLVMIGVDRVKDKDEKFLFIITKSLLWGLLGMLSIIITLWIQCHFFGLPYKGTLLGGFELTLLYSICMVSFGMLVIQVIPNKLFATQVSAILVLPTSVLGGYTFPLMSMPVFFQKLGALLPFVHYSEPMRDLIMKPIGISYVYGNIIWLLEFLICVWILCAIVFFTKKGAKILLYREMKKEGTKLNRMQRWLNRYD